MVIQGRNITADEISLIRDLMALHREWGRTRLSEELCRRWDWRNAQGRVKDMAARTLLLKLERRGFIELPARQRPSSNAFRNRRVPIVDHAREPIRGSLGDLRPLSVSIVSPRSPDMRLFNALLARYHYLGHRNTVGENLRYSPRPTWSAGGLRAVRLGGVEERRSRRLSAMGSGRASAQPTGADQQYPLFGVATGRGSASGQSCTGVDRTADLCWLAG